MSTIESTSVWRRLGEQSLAAGIAPVRLLLTQPATPWRPIVFYGSFAAGFIVWNLLDDTLPAWAFVALPLAGVFLWTVLEYVIHSIGFHWPTQSPTFLSIQASHGTHHEDPTDPARIVSNLSFSFPVALLVYGCLALALWSAKTAGMVMVGVILGYLAYEVIHYRIHLGRKTRWFPRFLIRHHLYHHHKDPTRCYGVTTPIWDWILGTGRVPRRRRAASS
jgi:sterol desaturase/sphingolipid hydroxylase (fatty acid hydroxylase superfamily)